MAHGGRVLFGVHESYRIRVGKQEWDKPRARVRARVRARARARARVRARVRVRSAWVGL